MTNSTANLPATVAEIQSMGDAFYKSGYFKDVVSAAQALVKIQAGRELGLNPIYSMQNIIVINDNITSNANTLALLIKKSGKYDYRVVKNTDEETVIKFLQRSYEQWEEIGENSFSVKDAERAGLTGKATWKAYPKAMTFARALSQGARQHCPDAIGGVYLSEEIESIPAAPTMPTVTVVPPADTTKFIPAPSAEVMSDEEAQSLFDKPQNGKTSQVIQGTTDKTDGDLKLGHVPQKWLEDAYNKLPPADRKKVVKMAEDYGYGKPTLSTNVACLNPAQANIFTQYVQGLVDKAESR